MKIEDQRLSLVFGEIERRDDILASKIFRNSKTFISSKLWPILDPIIQHHRRLVEEAKLLSPIEKRILAVVESTGPIRTDSLRRKLGFEGRENAYKFHRALTNLESYSLIVGAEDPKPEKHLHANIWQTWEKRTGRTSSQKSLSYQEAVEQLLEKTLETCVLVDERQIRKWFRWNNETETAKEKLLKKNTIVRIDTHVIKRGTMEVLSHLR